MKKRIRSMIDEIFCEMKMTADNLALRDELMANAMARYEDAVSQGMSEEDAFAGVAESLDDVQGLIREMNAMENADEPQEKEEAVPHLTVDPSAQAEEPEKAEKAEKTVEEELGQTDLGAALNKAFSALGDFSQAVMPEAKKLVRQMDDATGGMIMGLGRAAKKGIRDVQKAAEETIDKLSAEAGERMNDFGKKAQQSAAPAGEEAPAQEEPAKEEPVHEAAAQEEAAQEESAQEEAAQEDGGELILEVEKKEEPKSGLDEADALRAQAQELYAQEQDLYAQAALKDVTGDAQNAQMMRIEAQTLRIKAQTLEMEAAELELEAYAVEEEPEAPQAETESGASLEQDVIGADGEINEEAFAKAVDDLAREAEETIRSAGAQESEYTVRGADEPVTGGKTFPAAGLHKVDIKLDADDVRIEPAEGTEIETLWEARSVEGEPVVTMHNHVLTIRRQNPDIFKTFFSVIAKNGGQITVRVPAGYAAQYEIGTTSGDVQIGGVDADDIRVSTTSGNVRVEPMISARVGGVTVTTVSGSAAVSACADDVSVSTVSGNQFISCDAHKVDVNAVSGKVHVEGSCDEWEVSSVSSDVELLCTVAPTKGVRLETMHGTVRLALPSEIRGFAVETGKAIKCEVVNEFGADRYGTCALPIRMDTMHGRLMITRL